MTDHNRGHRRSPSEEAALAELRRSIEKRRRERPPPRAGVSAFALPIGLVVSMYLFVRLVSVGGELELWLGLIAAVVMTGCVAWDVGAERRRHR